jgi:hypothetical protein
MVVYYYHSFSNENHQVTNGKSSNHEGSNRVESNDSKKAQSCAKHPSGRKKMRRSRGMNQNSRAVRSLFVHCIHIEGIFAMLNLDWIVPWRWIPMDDRLRAFLPIGKEKQRSSWIEPINGGNHEPYRYYSTHEHCRMDLKLEFKVQIHRSGPHCSRDWPFSWIIFS